MWFLYKTCNKIILLFKTGWNVTVSGVWIIIPLVIIIIILFNGIDSSNFIPILILRPIMVLATYLLKNEISSNRRILNNIFYFYVFIFGMLIVFENVVQKEWKLSEFWPAYYFAIFLITPIAWINYK